MALSEGLKSFVNFITGIGGGDDDAITTLDGGIDDLYTDAVDGNVARDLDSYKTTTRPSIERSSKVSNLSPYKAGEIMVVEPRSFSESAQIVKRLLDNKTVVLHLDLLDKEQSQRTIDFVCGAAHALNGTAKKISDAVFIFTPSNFSLCDETSASQGKFAESSLWKPTL